VGYASSLGGCGKALIKGEEDDGNVYLLGSEGADEVKPSKLRHLIIRNQRISAMFCVELEGLDTIFGQDTEKRCFRAVKIDTRGSSAKI
jgi:hypothetical protein